MSHEQHFEEIHNNAGNHGDGSGKFFLWFMSLEVFQD